MARILSIVAPEQFQQIEYLESKKALEEAGHQVLMASAIKAPTDKLGKAYTADLLLSEAKAKDFDVILFVGGPGSHAYFDDPVCHRLAREFYEAGKLTTAICAAPVILGRAGLLKGKKATCWPGQTLALKSCGVECTGNPVERDGLIITGDGPKSAYEFGKRIAEVLIEL